MSSGSLLCPEWQERHENLLLFAQGDSINPLYSRPLTRTMPSGQKKSRMIPGLEARYAARAGLVFVEDARMIGVVSSKSSPGRYRKPVLRQFSAASIHFME